MPPSFMMWSSRLPQAQALEEEETEMGDLPRLTKKDMLIKMFQSNNSNNNKSFPLDDSDYSPCIFGHEPCKDDDKENEEIDDHVRTSIPCKTNSIASTTPPHHHHARGNYPLKSKPFHSPAASASTNATPATNAATTATSTYAATSSAALVPQSSPTDPDLNKVLCFASMFRARDHDDSSTCSASAYRHNNYQYGNDESFSTSCSSTVMVRSGQLLFPSSTTTSMMLDDDVDNDDDADDEVQFSTSVTLPPHLPPFPQPKPASIHCTSTSNGSSTGTSVNLKVRMENPPSPPPPLPRNKYYNQEDHNCGAEYEYDDMALTMASALTAPAYYNSNTDTNAVPLLSSSDTSTKTMSATTSSQSATNTTASTDSQATTDSPLKQQQQEQQQPQPKQANASPPTSPKLFVYDDIQHLLSGKTHTEGFVFLQGVVLDLLSENAHILYQLHAKDEQMDKLLSDLAHMHQDYRENLVCVLSALFKSSESNNNNNKEKTMEKREKTTSTPTTSTPTLSSSSSSSSTHASTRTEDDGEDNADEDEEEFSVYDDKDYNSEEEAARCEKKKQQLVEKLSNVAKLMGNLSNSNTSDPSEMMLLPMSLPVVEATKLVMDHLNGKIFELEKENTKLLEKVQQQQERIDDLTAVNETRLLKIEALELQFQTLNQARANLAQKLVDKTNNLMTMKLPRTIVGGGRIPRVVNVVSNDGGDENKASSMLPPASPLPW